MPTIGRYVVIEELARGGAGVVYRARDPAVSREVAIKVLHAEGGGSPHARKRFLREATALGRLRHPGIVPLFDAGEVGGRPYLVLALIDGESLEQRLEREGPLPIREAAELVRDAAWALQHAHEQSLLHRDVKPSNVLLDRGGRVLVTDFGLVKDLELAHSRTRLTRSGVFLGTPGFWAPEQARGQTGRVGPWTDVYGLGATLYAALVGEPPRAGRTLAEVLEKAQQPVVPPSGHRPEVGPGLDAICLRCLALEPEERYGTAAELAVALDGFLQGQGSAARPTRRIRRRAAVGAGAVGLLLAAGGGLTLGARLLGEGPRPAGVSSADAPAGPSSEGGDPEAAWAHLRAASATADLEERAELLVRAREAAGPRAPAALRGAVDAALLSALRLLVERLTARSFLTVPELDRSSRRLAAARRLAEAAGPDPGEASGPDPGEAGRLAERAVLLLRADVLAARSRLDEPFDPLLAELGAVLEEAAGDAEAAARIRLELGLMYARGARFPRALRTLEPLFAASGPAARVARAESITIAAMCREEVDTVALVEAVLAEDAEDPWRHVARQRAGIQRGDRSLQLDAEETLVASYPDFWFSALNVGDRHIMGRQTTAARRAYDRAEQLSPRDARVWWWQGATLGSALSFARLGVLPEDVVAELTRGRQEVLADLRGVLPPGTPLEEPAWDNVR